MSQLRDAPPRPARWRTSGWIAIVALLCSVNPGAAAPPHVASPLDAPAPLEAFNEPAGPVPDYGLVGAIVTHTYLDALAPEVAQTLTALLGARHAVETYDPGEREGRKVVEDGTLMWMRDYQLIYVRRPDGNLTGVRYLALNPNRAAYLSERRHTFLRRDGHARAPLGPVSDIVELPLIHENGNLVVAGRFVFVTERLLEDNAAPQDQPHLRRAGWRPRAPADTIALLAKTLHVDPDDVVVLPSLPGEATAHIDLFLLPLGPGSVLVPEIRDEALDALTDAADLALAQEAAAFLDAQSDRIAELGLDVVRAPMLPPMLMPAVDDPKSRDAIYYSPANALLLQTPEAPLALVPTVDLDAFTGPMYRLTLKYRAEVAAIFAANGWRPLLVEATALGRHLGLLRCVTGTIPRG